MQRSLYKFKPWLDPNFVIETVEIPAGMFWMGSPEGKGSDNEKPYHKVTVPAFCMGKYPVTQAQWRTVALSPKVNRDLSLYTSKPSGDSCPVEQITWHDAQEFCARLSKLTGQTYRLPSEAEWEYACRAGTTTAYYFGDNENILGDYAWYRENSRPKNNPVGQKKPNQWGLYDMHGNVWEWCQDDWHKNYQGAPTDGSDWVNKDDFGIKVKLLRGGSGTGSAKWD